MKIVVLNNFAWKLILQVLYIIIFANCHNASLFICILFQTIIFSKLSFKQIVLAYLFLYKMSYQINFLYVLSYRSLHLRGPQLKFWSKMS